MLDGIAAAWTRLDTGFVWGILVDGWVKGILLLGVTWLGLRLAPRKDSAARHLESSVNSTKTPPPTF